MLSGGSENTNIKVDSKKCDFIITIFETKTSEDVVKIVDLLKHLHSHDFTSNQVIASKSGSYLYDLRGKPIILRTFIDGEVNSKLSDTQLFLTGRLMGKLHTLPCPEFLPESFSYGIESFEKIEGENSFDQFNEWLINKRTFCELLLKQKLPKNLIHGDVFTDNVIIDDKSNPVIIDFEEACNYYRVFDLGMASVGLCRSDRTIDVSMLKHLLKGYALEIELQKNEKLSIASFIVYASAATAIWRFRQFNIIHPEMSMHDHYTEMADIADWAQENEKLLTANIIDFLKKR